VGECFCDEMTCDCHKERYFFVSLSTIFSNSQIRKSEKLGLFGEKAKALCVLNTESRINSITTTLSHENVAITTLLGFILSALT
jgi:hypothetical protein